MPAFFFCKNNFAYVGLERPIFLPCKLSNSCLLNNNEIFLMTSIVRPCKYELSVRIEMVLNEAIFSP